MALALKRTRFAALGYLIFCYPMSRYSGTLERRQCPGADEVRPDRIEIGALDGNWDQVVWVGIPVGPTCYEVRVLSRSCPVYS